MVTCSHVICNLKRDEDVEEFHKGVTKTTKKLLEQGYLPSELEYHYQQSDLFISCLIVAKKDK